MAKTTIYAGKVERIYEILSFNSLMINLDGQPIAEFFKSENDGGRYCTWKFPSNCAVNLRYYHAPHKKELQAIITAEGDRKEVDKLKKLILEEDLKRLNGSLV